MRLSDKELEKVKKKYGISQLWSFSRIDNYRNSKYEYFLKYIKREDPLGETSPYGQIGGDCHDLIESMYDGKVKYEDMADEFDTIFATNIDMLDLKFNRTDEEKNKLIKKKYYDDLMHFFKHYKKLNYKMFNEKFIAVKVSDDIVLQGYIDNLYKDHHGNYVITDYKTSSMYRGKDIISHSYQLVIYAEGLRQAGIPADKIQIRWNFLKYVNVMFEQINGKFAETAIERFEIGSKLKAKAKSWLKHLKYSDSEIDEYLNEMLISNSIDCLPEEVRNKFQIDDCYVYIPDWQNIWEDLREEIIEIVAEIEAKKKEYEETGDDKIWWDDEEHLKEQEYYLWNLTDYRPDQLADFSDFINRKEAEKQAGQDLLGVTKDNELSWLEDI